MRIDPRAGTSFLVRIPELGDDRIVPVTGGLSGLGRILFDADVIPGGATL